MNFIRYGHKPTNVKVEAVESTMEVLQEEKIELTEQDTVAEVVEKVKKSKKVHAKVTENGKKVKVKRVLQG